MCSFVPLKRKCNVLYLFFISILFKKYSKGSSQNVNIGYLHRILFYFICYFLFKVLLHMFNKIKRNWQQNIQNTRNEITIPVWEPFTRKQDKINFSSFLEITSVFLCWIWKLHILQNLNYFRFTMLIIKFLRYMITKLLYMVYR